MNQLGQLSDAELLDDAIALLADRLPSKWGLEKTAIGGDSEPRDLIVKSPNGTSQTAMVVEARSEVTTRDVQVLLGAPWKRWRRLAANYPILVVAPYIGPRVRELLATEGVNYLDLTGNVRISVDYPGIFIEFKGADRDESARKPRRGLGGAKVGAVVRVLADAAPPFTGSQIARAAGVNEGYTSRILGTLADEGLITRDRTGPIKAVDWPAMLRRRAQALDLFRPVGAYRFIARQGPRQLLKDMSALAAEDAPTITGSFAAARLAAVAAPRLLVAYTMSPRDLASNLDLLPADTGADTILIRPDNRVVFDRPKRDSDGLVWAGPSQIAIDCLAGSGRMPAEGEAVIQWMLNNEKEWRYPSIEKLLLASEARDSQG